nr:LuxR C-terminal-related transcriptional regulator [uncultured Sphaerochaeta sp.]
MIEPEKQYLLRRQQLQRSLKAIDTVPLLVAIATIGYGKTTAINQLMEMHPQMRFAYVNLPHETSNTDYLWKRIIKRFHLVVPELGRELDAFPVPRTVEERELCAEVVGCVLRDDPLVLVLDDYHHAKSKDLDLLIEHFAQYPKLGLHILVLSRTSVSLPVDELVLKGSCKTLYADAFQFTQEDIHTYAGLYGVLLTPAQEYQLLTMSEGWIAAIHLILQQFRNTGRLAPSASLYRLIAGSEIPRYSKQKFWLLQILSALQEFNASLASTVCRCDISPLMAEQFEYESSFIYHDEENGMYRMHPLFREYLQKEYAKNSYQQQGSEARSCPSLITLETIYSRAGRWYLERQTPVLGFSYLLKAHAYDTIMEEFSKASRNRLLDAEPSFIVSLFNVIPDEVRNRHFYPWLAYIGFYITNIDITAAETLLAEFQSVLHTRRKSLSEQQVQAIEGEMALIKAYGMFNDANEMSRCFQQAFRLLGGRSRIADKDKIITFGSPHALYLYHRRKGSLDETLRTVIGMFPFYSEIAGGCGKGFDDLLGAECSLERGELQKAELFSYRSFYKASSLDQHEVILSSQFCLARLAVAKGNIQEARSIMELQREKIARLNSPILQASYELCVAYIASMVNNRDEIAPWIREGMLDSSSILYHGKGFIYVVYGKYLLMQKSYIQVEVFAERMKEIMSQFSNQIGYLHAYIQEAAAKYMIYGLQSAEIPLIRALEIGFADDIVVPFAEYSSDIMDILMEIKKRYRSGLLLPHSAQSIAFSSYLEKVISLVLDYFASMKDCQDDANVLALLSKRELEILTLLIQGKTNQSIARELFVAEVTVRKHLTALYKKLDVRGRAEAVRRALELGIA